MATKITSRVIAPGAVTAEALAPGVGAGPVIANVQIANSSYSVLDDTAVALDGGYIIINGDNFGQNTQVIIANTNATSVTYISSSLVRAQVPAKSAGSYIMYLVNTDTGATAIRVNAVTYSGTPTWSTGSTLTEGDVDEAISIQLDATADSNVSYQLQTGSTLPDGFTLAANGLLSGVVTGITVNTLYNFTIEAIDAENQESPRAFSITITAGDQYINSTVLALNADDNTFITDASNNAFTITPAGDTRPSAFSPYNTSWSNFFDGTGDYLTLAYNSAFDVGGNDASVECWVYFNIAPVTQIINGQNSGGGSTMRMGVWSSTFRYTINNDVLRDTGITPVVGVWYHLCLTITGGVARFFINGVLRKTDSGLGNVSNRAELYAIGTEDSYAINGYISNFRFCNGSIPTSYQTSSTTVGAAIFSPPTSQLTTTSQGATSSHVKILTCQSNRFIDNSTNNFTLTRNGDVKVTAFAPFTDTDTSTGSSLYVSDATDACQIADNDNLSFTSTDDFTLECWVYHLGHRTYNYFFSKGTSGTREYGFGTSGSAMLFYWPGGVLSHTYTFLLNTWYHLAYTNTGGNLRFFINGELVKTQPWSGGISNTATPAWIGSFLDYRSIAHSFYGYLSDLRFIKGEALYTSSFAVPTAPRTNETNTQLLTHQNRISYNNSQPIDESGIRNIITRIGNASAGTFSPHTPAGWSAYFDGTGDYLSLTLTSTLNQWWTEDFTIDAWVYPTNLSTWLTNGNPCLIGNMSAGGSTNYWSFGPNTNGTVRFKYFNGGSVNVDSTETISLNQWSHIAFVKDTDGIRIYVNGVGTTSTAVSGTPQSDSTFTIGQHFSSSIQGYVSNIRVVKGTAVYTGNFTPPTAPLEATQSAGTNIAAITGTSTILLTCQSNRFIDNSTNNFAITRNGDTKITPFSPFAALQYSPASHGGSYYFDGTGDYLAIPNNENLDFGSGDFTIEFWVNFAIVGNATFVSKFNTSGNLGYEIILFSGLLYFQAQTCGLLINPSWTPAAGTWYHIAAVRNGTNAALYIDGTSVATDSSLTTITASNSPLYIGGRGNSILLNGYISGLRVLKGTALYTSAFVPPQAPATPIAGTTLLVNGTNAAIQDKTGRNVLETVGNARVVNGVKKFGSGAMYFDGTGDFIRAAPSDLFNVLGTEFTLEAWIYATDLASAGPFAILGKYGNWYWIVYGAANAGLFRMIGGGGAIVASATGANSGIQQDTWHHVAFTRDSSNIPRLFVDGNLVATGGAYTATFDNTMQLAIGSYLGSSAGYVWKGYIDDVRITRGVARYTENFDPPTSSFKLK